MRIALYSEVLGPANGHLVRWAALLSSAGHSVKVFTHHGGRLDEKSVEHQRLGLFGGLIAPVVTLVKRAMLKFMPEVVICFGDAAGLHIKAIKKTFPLVLGFVCGTKSLSRKLLANYAEADRVISDTYLLQGILSALGGSRPVDVISKSISISHKPDKAARLLLRRKMGARKDTTVILCKQPLQRGLLHSYLLECFACVRPDLDCQLWLVGKGRAYWWLKAYAHILDRKRIRVLKEEFAPAYYYSAADVAATASTQEDISDFLIDAHALGLPGICQNNGGCAEVVMNGLSGWVSPPGNEAFFVGALQEIVRNKYLRDMMSQNARSLSFRFDSHRQNQQILSMIEALG